MTFICIIVIIATIFVAMCNATILREDAAGMSLFSWRSTPLVPGATKKVISLDEKRRNTECRSAGIRHSGKCVTHCNDKFGADTHAYFSSSIAMDVDGNVTNSIACGCGDDKSSPLFSCSSKVHDEGEGTNNGNITNFGDVPATTGNSGDMEVPSSSDKSQDETSSSIDDHIR